MSNVVFDMQWEFRWMMVVLLIPVVVAILLFTYNMRHKPTSADVFYKGTAARKKYIASYIITKLLGTLCLCLALNMGIYYFVGYKTIVDYYEDSEYLYMIVGKVDNLETAEFWEFWKEDSFEIDGAKFSYGNPITNPAYHRKACYGGAIKEEGQAVMIKFLPTEDKYYIVHMELLENKAEQQNATSDTEALESEVSEAQENTSSQLESDSISD